LAGGRDVLASALDRVAGGEQRGSAEAGEEGEGEESLRVMVRTPLRGVSY
jgi:hypothetical protein